MSMELGFYAHRVIMLHSIEDENMGIVRRLHEHVEPLVTSHDELTFETHKVENPEDLFVKLTDISNSLNTKGIPLLHLDMHGNKENGIKLLSGDWVSWIDLSRKLSEINGKTGNRMFVVSAACAGMSVIYPPRLDEPSPFKGLFASSKNISLGEVEDVLTLFYSALFGESDLQKAVNTLKPTFNDFWPEKTLFHIIRKLITRYSGRPGSADREATTSFIVDNFPADKHLNLSVVRKKLKNYHSDFNDETLNRLTNTYLCGEAPFFDVLELKSKKYTDA